MNLKKFISLLSMSFLGVVGSAQATVLDIESASFVNAIVQSNSAENLIDWKIGDSMNYKMSVMGMSGTMIKSVASEEGNAVWLKQDVSIMGQKQLIEVLLDRATGQILKMRQNGQDKPVPKSDLEVISQEYTKVTVPAGTFDCMHVTAKSSDAPKIEIWANPRDTAMDGGLKQIVQSNGMTITLELTSFKRLP